MGGIEELLRRFGLPNTSRALTMDYTFNGVEMRKDDLILTPKCLAGLDDRVVDNPVAKGLVVNNRTILWLA